MYLGAEPELLPTPAEGEADDSHPVGTGKAAGSCLFTGIKSAVKFFISLSSFCLNWSWL